MIKNDEKTSRLLGVILAGGASTRMGGNDKFMLPLGEKRILDYIVSRLSPQVDALILNTNANNISAELKVVPDIGDAAGPLSGLYTVLCYARDNGFDKVVTVAGDTPFIPNDLVLRFMEHAHNAAVVAKSDDRIHPIIGLWDVSLIAHVKTALENNELKMMNFIKNYAAFEVVWDQEIDPFFNINTAEDLKKAEEIAQMGQLF